MVYGKIAAAGAWHLISDEDMREGGYEPSKHCPCLYKHATGAKVVVFQPDSPPVNPRTQTSGTPQWFLLLAPQLVARAL